MAEEIGDILQDVVDLGTSVVEGAVNIAKDVVDFVGDGLKKVEQVVKQVIKDPLPVIAQIAGAAVGIPPYVTAAVITAARGGDLEDIATSAAVAYVSSKALTSTTVGQSVTGVTQQIGVDATETLIKNFNLPTEVAYSIGRATSAGLNSAIIGGVRAGITGQNVVQGITSGFTSGAIYSGTDSFFDSVNSNPNWGLSDTTVNLIKGSTSSALNAIVKNQDAAAAVGNFIAYSTIQMAGSEVEKRAKTAYQDFIRSINTAQASQDEYTRLKGIYDQRVDEYNNLRTDVQSKVDSYNKLIGDKSFVSNKGTQLNIQEFQGYLDAHAKEVDKWVNAYNIWRGRYDGYVAAGDITQANDSVYYVNNAAKRAEEAIENYNKLYESNKTKLGSTIDLLGNLAGEIESGRNTLTNLASELNTPSGNNLAAQIKAAADKYQKDFDLYKVEELKATQATEVYEKAIAEVATRDAIIDAVNSKVISVKGTTSSGGYVLSNNMTLGADGKFYRNNQIIFPNASGIDQKELEFTDNKGMLVTFDEDAIRRLSTTDVKNIFKRDYGIEITTSQAEQFSDLPYKDYDKTVLQAFAAPRQEVIKADPNFKPEEYRAINKLGADVDVYDHWRKEGQYQELPTNTKALQSAIYEREAELLIDALESRGLEVTNLTKADQNRFYAAIANKYGNDITALNKGSISDLNLNEIFQTSIPDTESKTLKSTYRADNRPSTSVYTPPSGYTLATQDQILNNQAVLMPTKDGNMAWITGSSTSKDGYRWDPERKEYVLRINIRGTGADNGIGDTLGELRDADPLGWFQMFSDYIPATKAKTSLGDTVYNFLQDAYNNFKTKLTPSQKEAIANFAAAATPESTTLDIMTGVVNSFKAISDAFGANNRVSKALNGAKDYIYSLYSAEALKDQKLQGQIIKDAQDKKVLDQLIAAAEAVAAYPGVIAQAAGSIVPNIMMATATSILNAPAVIARLSQFGLGTVSGAGIIKGTIYDETKKALIDAGVNPGVAEIKAQQAQAYNGKNLDSIVAGALLTGIAGSTGVEKNLVASITNNVAERIAAREVAKQFVVGGLKEAIPEAAQAGQEKLAENIALQREGFEVPTWRGVVAAGALEGIAGAPAGSATNVLEKVNKYDAAYTSQQELEAIAKQEGYTLTPADFNQFGGIKEETKALQDFRSFADPRATTQAEATDFFKSQGYTKPTAEQISTLTKLSEADAQREAINIADPYFFDAQEIKAAAESEGYTITDDQARSLAREANEAAETAKYKTQIDPLAVTKAEATEFFKEFNYVPNAAEINQFIQSKPESEVRKNIVDYVNPRQVTYAEAEKYLTDLGYRPTKEEVQSFVGQVNEENQAKAIAAYVNPRQVTASEAERYLREQGYTPTKEEIDRFTGQINEQTQKEAIAAYVNPRQVTRAEAEKFFADLNYKPTEQEITQFIKQGGVGFEEQSKKDIAAYVDPRYLDIDEIKAIAAAEGYAINDDQAKALVRQVNEEQASAQFRSQIDPLAVTSAEAKDFFNTFGYPPSDEELSQFIASKPEDVVRADLQKYVDARQVTQTEAEKFFADLGYKPTADEVNNYIKQGKDIRQDQIGKDIAAYVDPRFVDRAEILEAARAEGIQLTEDQINALVGQRDEAKSIAEARAGFDPLAVTESEAKEFFATFGYPPSAAELAQFVLSKPESDVKSLIGTYVDPRQVTQAEVENFIKSTGYEATPEEVSQYVKQGPDVVQADILKGLEQYIDPRYVSADEVRQALLDLGITKPTEADVKALVGQYAETDLTGKAEKAAPQIRYASLLEEIGNLGTELKGDLKTQYDTLTAAQKAEVDARIKMGQDLQTAINQAAEVTGKKITDLQTNLDARITQLQKEGLDRDTALQTALTELQQETIAGQKAIQEQLVATNVLNQAQKLQQAEAARRQGLMQSAMALIAPAAAPAMAEAPYQFKKPFITSTAKQEEFTGSLDPFLKEVAQSNYLEPSFMGAEMQRDEEVRENTQQGEEFMPNYFTYGESTDLDQLFNPRGGMGTSFFEPEPFTARSGGLVPPLMAAGGTTRYGRYAGGGLPVVAHSGKARLDFRDGAAVTGAGDGQSDDIPAMLADGEFVIPADVVAALGNGSTKAGSDKLYDMMHSIRAQHRSARPQDLPPPAKKNPLDYLKSARKARR